jgi:hypothetical protein
MLSSRVCRDRASRPVVLTISRSQHKTKSFRPKRARSCCTIRRNCLLTAIGLKQRSPRTSMVRFFMQPTLPASSHTPSLS